jgi:hypothetical protein
VTEAAESDDTHAIPALHPEFFEWGVCCNACAEKRSRSGQRKCRGDAEDVVFIDDDLVGIAAIGRSFLILLRGVVGEREVAFAELLEALSAVRTGSAGVDEATNADKVPDFKPGDVTADLGDVPCDLVTRNHGVYRVAPLATCLMYIGVTDAAVIDLQKYVIRAGLTPYEVKRF